MLPYECRTEADVLQAVVEGQWPDQCDRGLLAHVEGCSTCRDLVAVAPLLREDAAAARRAASVPSAGTVWYRAQVRMRADAERRAIRPVHTTAALAAACTCGLLAGALTLGSAWVRQTFAQLADAPVRVTLPALDGAAVIGLVTNHDLRPFGVVALLILATAVALVVASREPHQS
jgi:hypothetical protein